MLAALLASLMSTLTSVFNSASSIVTLDLWSQIRKKAKQAELMIVGRVTVLIMIGISILWLPILQAQQGGLLWFYVAAINAYLSVPLCMVFLLGMFWKRTTEPVRNYTVYIYMFTYTQHSAKSICCTVNPRYNDRICSQRHYH